MLKALSYLSLNRLVHWWKMHRNAKFLGVPFYRRASFLPPHSVIINGQAVELLFLDEEGTKWDFISIFLEDIYGLKTTRGDIRSILDIGGNMGFFSVAARNQFPHSKIHCYEPNRDLFKFVTVQARTNNFGFFPEAVGGHCGSVSMDFSAGGDSNLGRTIDDASGPVPKISLDDAVERLGGSVDLLKLDCEGAEWEMFREGRCWAAISALRMEYHLFNGETHQFLRETLRSIGFTLQSHQFSERSHYGHVHAVNDKVAQ